VRGARAAEARNRRGVGTGRGAAGEAVRGAAGGGGGPGRRRGGPGVARGQGRARGVGERRRKRKGREREEGAHHGDPNSGDQCLQNLGHHGEEREVGERGSFYVGELNEGKRPGKGGAWGGAGRQGRAGRGRVGLGREPKSRGTHNHGSEFNSRSKIRNETKQHTRLNTTSDKRNMIRHDATPMST
jgi:hypothetical protein